MLLHFTSHIRKSLGSSELIFHLQTWNFYRKCGGIIIIISNFFIFVQEQAASTVVYCAAHPSMEGIGGLYMYECWPAEPSPEAQDPSTSTALWELSEQIITEKMDFSS